MNHVLSIVIRSRGLCLWKSPCVPISSTFVRSISALTNSPASLLSLTQTKQQYTPGLQIRNLSQTNGVKFAQSFTRQKLVAYKPTAKEQGLSFRTDLLNSIEINQVFGQHTPSKSVANQLLRVLHGRRVDGTLDLPLPKEFDPILRKYPTAVEDGLFWLRENYPIDEDEAIMQRLDREEAQQEKQNPSDLLRRGEELGLYKPQSGHYQAPLSEVEGDVFGVSQIEKRRAENIAKAEKEEEDLQQEIEKLQEEVKEKRLAIQPENSLEASSEIRPPNLYEKWVLRAKMQASSPLTIDSPEVAAKGPWRRLFPSFLFVTFITGLSYLYATTWIPPKPSERLFPSYEIGFTTVAGIIATNFLIFALWKFPPAWRMLNKYFISVPGIPVPISFFGNVFSHQQLKHLTINMLWVLVFGFSLHEDIGRGNFMGLWVAGGVIGSFVSASSYVFRGILFTSHLGASGAVSAMVAAYCTLHANDRFTFFIIPKDWQDTISFTGLQFFVAIILWEVATLLSIRYSPKYLGTDFAAHFGGSAVGLLAGLWFRGNKEMEKERKSKPRVVWVEHLFGSNASNRKS